MIVQQTNAQTLAVCQPPAETWLYKLLPSAPAILISLLALAVSFWSALYNRNKDARARQQSIEDDFWLRKVVSPLFIEPFLKYVHQLAVSLPIASPSTNATAVQDLWKERILKLSEFAVGFRTLVLISDDVETDVAKDLESIEDTFADYCGQLMQHLGSGAPAPDHVHASNRIMAISIEVLRRIKAHQGKVGIGQ